VDYAQENELLWKWGFHLAYDAEDGATAPQDINPAGEIWQLGSSESAVRPWRQCSRAVALRYARWKERGR
jgi:hypothetical protein